MAKETKSHRTRHCGPRRKRSKALSTNPDFPYTMRLHDGRTLCVEVPGRWVTADRDGTPAFLPKGVAFLDRIRALFSSVLDRAPSPGYIVALRHGLGLTQAQLGERLGVDKMTVYRWECGVLHPGKTSLRAMEKLRKQSVRRGVTIES